MNILIFGPQASGKGTQADLLAKKFNLLHFEMGEILREIAKQDSPRGKMFRDLNERKEMFPDEVVLQLLENYIVDMPKDKGVIFDGIPRTVSQIKPVEELFAKLGRPVEKAIYITLPREESIRRVTKRYDCPGCNRKLVLGIDINSPEDACPTCGGVVEQRVDDTPDGIRKRLGVFYSITLPVMEYYREKGLLIEVDGTQSVEKVFENIVAQL